MLESSQIVNLSRTESSKIWTRCEREVQRRSRDSLSEAATAGEDIIYKKAYTKVRKKERLNASFPKNYAKHSHATAMSTRYANIVRN